MKIAVITPTKPNRAQLLEECRASVREQTRAADTHAVAIDGTLEGPSAVRNRLILELPPEYDWVAFLDDDDVMLPDHLKVLSSASEGADVIYSLCQIECNTREFDPEAIKQSNYIPVTALVRRSIFNRVGGFSDVPLEDWVLWQKISDAGGRFKFVPKVTWTYRVQSDSRNFVK